MNCYGTPHETLRRRRYGEDPMAFLDSGLRQLARRYRAAANATIPGTARHAYYDRWATQMEENCR